MLGKREAQGRIAKMVEDALKEIARLKKMNFFIVKLQRIYRGKAARNFVDLLRLKIKCAAKIQATWKMYVFRKKFLAKVIKKIGQQKYLRKIIKIQAVMRGKLARNYVLHLLDQIDAATFLQKFMRGKLGRNKLKRLKWARDHKLIVEKLYESRKPLQRIATANRIKLQVASGIYIKNWILARHKKHITMVLYRKLVAKRKRSAILIQKMIRGYLARCLFDRREAYRRQHINGLKSVLLIKKLGTGHGMGNSYRIGDADRYGYCSKCDCNKFGVADSTKPLICYCGHFITNHVVGVFRDSEKEDYYIAKKPKRSTMTKRFHMATGVERNFDSFYKFLRSTMDTKTLRQSLNASSAPIQLSLEIRKPSVTDLQKYIRKKLTSPRFLVGQDVLDGKTETPSGRSQRMIQQHIKRIRARRKLNGTQRGGEDLFAPRKIKKNMLFKPQLLSKKDQTVKLDEQEIKDVEFVEMQAKASLERTRKKISNIQRLDQEIKLTETNIKRMRKISDTLKEQDKLAKKMAIEKNRRFKMEKEKHFYALTLDHMNDKPLQSVHKQLINEFKQGIEEDVDDYLKHPPKSLNDLKRRNYLKQHKKKMALKKGIKPKQNKTMKKATKMGDRRKIIPDSSEDGNYDDDEFEYKDDTFELEDMEDEIKEKQKTVAKSTMDKRGKQKNTKKKTIKSEHLLRSMVNNVGTGKTFFGGNNKKKYTSKNVKQIKSTKKKRKGRVSPTFAEPIPVDKDDIEEERTLPKYETIINMLKNAVQNVEGAMMNGTPYNDLEQRQQPPRQIFPLHTVEPSPVAIETPPKQPNMMMRLSNNNSGTLQKSTLMMSGGGISNGANNLMPTPIKTNVKKKSNAKTKILPSPSRPICATLQLIEDSKSSSSNNNNNNNDNNNNNNLNPATFNSNNIDEEILRDIPKELRIYEGRTVVGRERSCDLVLDSKIQSRMVSKVHAMIYSTFDNKGVPQMHLVDCNSTNGTYVDGKRCSIARVSLQNGSTIMFGKKSRKKERRSELVYVVNFHTLFIPPPTPKRIRPLSSELQFMESTGGGDNNNNMLIGQAASVPIRRKSSFLYDQLPSTPEVGSELHNQSGNMMNFMEGDFGDMGGSSSGQSSGRRYEDDGELNTMEGNGFKKMDTRKRYEDVEQPSYMQSSGGDNNNNNYTKNSQSNNRKSGTFPSLLVLRAPSRGNSMNTTDTLLSKAWPSSDQLNWVIRGSSRHRRIRRRLTQSNPVAAGTNNSPLRRRMDDGNNKLETL